MIRCWKGKNKVGDGWLGPCAHRGDGVGVVEGEGSEGKRGVESKKKKDGKRVGVVQGRQIVGWRTDRGTRS